MSQAEALPHRAEKDGGAGADGWERDQPSDYEPCDIVKKAPGLCGWVVVSAGRLGSE